MKKVHINESQLHLLFENKVNLKKLYNTTFISYGTNEFDSNKMRDVNVNGNEYIMSLIRNKPFGGLWASPLESDNSWGSFCDRESFNLKTLSKHFLFKISKNAKIYIIDNIKDLIKLSTEKNYYGQNSLNIKYLKSNYDGIFVSDNGASKLRYVDVDNLNTLSSWDVESICIWNNDVIIPIEENAFEHANVPNYADGEIYPDEYDDGRKGLQMDNDFIKYGNQNIHSDMSKFFNGEHPSILSQMHGNNKKTKLAKKFDGTIKSGL